MKRDGSKKKDYRKTWLASLPWLLLLGLLLPAMLWMWNREPAGLKLSYGELTQLLRTDPASHLRFRDVKVGRSWVTGTIVTEDPCAGHPEGKQTVTVQARFHTPRVGLERDTESLVSLLKARVGPEFRGEDEESLLESVGSIILSMVFIVVAFLLGFLLLRWLMTGSGSPLTFGRSRHKLYAEQDLHTTFNDVAGADEAVAELREIVDFLKNPERYQKLGGRIPKGVLLVGPPGTGKTLLARAVAGEADVPFFSMSGSDFVELFVGVGASRVRDLFSQAEARAPCIIFIDELDALGKTRGAGALAGHDEREQTLNQLLVEMDGFDSNRGVIIMAATNRPETLDAALLRPGRFDRTVVVDRPDLAGREAILKVHTRNVRLADDVDLRHIAAITPGSVGADLENIINEAALLAARKNQDAVGMSDLEEAVERSQVGLQRKSRIMSDAEKRRVAYHEAGHALVSCVLPHADPVHKVTIIPRGVGALGYVLSRPDGDRFLLTQSQLESMIQVALAGTISEEMIFGEISNGAKSDLETANRIAQQMVREFGMSPLGRVMYPEHSHNGFLDGLPNGDHVYSEATAREIDLEVRRIIDTCLEKVRGILREYREVLETVAQRLIEQEVIDGTELRRIIDDFQHHTTATPDIAPTRG